VGAPGITEAQAQKLDNKVATTSYSWERQPFASYDLTNNNSEIKRLTQRIAEVTRNREVGFAGWEFDGGQAEANTDADRLQLFFDAKPSESQRAALKANGFHWAPSEGAWQRQLNSNAIYAAGRLDFLKPTDGRTVREHVNDIGELVKPGFITQNFPATLEKNGMRRIRFHDLRHSCASLLYANGVSLKEIQEWLGHSDIGTTSNIYTHLDFNSKIASANAIIGVYPTAN
jgi:hypothetical protein